MKSNEIILLVLALAICAWTGVWSIQCYKCNSYDDPGCADYFRNYTYSRHACPDSTKYCRKIVQQAFYEGAWHMRYIRQCGGPTAEFPNSTSYRKDWYCYEKLGNFRVKVRYCHCRVDGCNDAARAPGGPPALASLLAVAGLVWAGGYSWNRFGSSGGDSHLLRHL